VVVTTTIDPLAVRNKADWLWLAIQEQTQRIFDRLPADNRPSHLEVARLSSEFDFFIDAVSRLLRLADLTQAEVHGANLLKAIGAFNTVSPDVRKVWDTIQHFDAYSLGKGRRQNKGEAISEFLFTKKGSSGDLVVTYAKLKVAVNATTMAAGSLHNAIRSAVDVEARKDPGWDEPIA